MSLAAVSKSLNPAFVEKHGVKVIELADGQLTVAMRDPADRAAIAALAFATGCEIVPVPRGDASDASRGPSLMEQVALPALPQREVTQTRPFLLTELAAIAIAVVFAWQTIVLWVAICAAAAAVLAGAHLKLAANSHSETTIILARIIGGLLFGVALVILVQR